MDIGDIVNAAVQHIHLIQTPVLTVYQSLYGMHWSIVCHQNMVRKHLYPESTKDLCITTSTNNKLRKLIEFEYWHHECLFITFNYHDIL